MLGGPVYIAFIRWLISLFGIVLSFIQIGKSRFGTKKTILCYGGFCVSVSALACIWYVVDWASCVRMVAFAMYICFVYLPFG